MDVQIPCPCPGTPHETDTVTLRDTLGFAEATAIRKGITLIGEDGEPMVTEERLARAVEGYVLFGVSAWTLTDEDGKPVPVSKGAVAERLLTHDEAAFEVGEVADGLYARKVLLPLLVRASNSSRTTPTDESTSRPSGSSTPPTPSSPSSISTIPTVGTARTSKSRGGGSSSSRSSKSAA